MSIYAIGDVQGCFDALMKLLEKINFNPKKDQLWFTGDLVNRGNKSLETLRFIKSLDSHALSVLGNHDITLLALAYDAVKPHADLQSLQDILNAPDKIELIEWLRHRSLLHHEKELNYLLVHAGIYPEWNIEEALALAKEAENYFLQDNPKDFLSALYQDNPTVWSFALTGMDRIRFIINCFTRMRFCSLQGELDLKTKEKATHDSSNFLPWFKIPQRKTQNHKIIFGHWAALKGHTETKNVFALDTGCVWGQCLTAMRLEDNHLISVNC